MTSSAPISCLDLITYFFRVSSRRTDYKFNLSYLILLYLRIFYISCPFSTAYRPYTQITVLLIWRTSIDKQAVSHHEEHSAPDHLQLIDDEEGLKDLYLLSECIFAQKYYILGLIFHDDIISTGI